MKSASASRLIASVALAGGLLWALIRWGGVELSDITETISDITLTQWLTALAVHSGIYLLRAWRFSVLTPTELRPPFWKVLSVSSAHNLAAYVLPLKSGEATFVLYSSKVGDVPARASVASLLVSRLLDLFVLSACLAAVSLLGPVLLLDAGGEATAQERTPSGLADQLSALFGYGVFFTVMCVSTLSVCILRTRLVSLLASCLRLIQLERTSLGGKLLGGVSRFGEALEQAGAGGGLLKATLLSAALWSGVVAFYSVLLFAFGWPEGEAVVVPSVLASGFASLANTLPVNGFAGFGTQEGGWVLGMSLWGIDTELALAVGLSAHLVQLGNLILFGLLGHLGMAAPSKSER